MFDTKNDPAIIEGRSWYVKQRELKAVATKALIISNVETTLDERGARYGKFNGHAEITQRLKTAMAGAGGWSRLNASQREALEMIAHKIGRILNGDPNYADSWHDIAGYSKLVEDQLNGVVR